MSELLTVAEVAKILRVDDNTVRRWVDQGTIDAVMLPSATSKRPRYRITREALNKVLNATATTKKSKVSA